MAKKQISIRNLINLFEKHQTESINDVEKTQIVDNGNWHFYDWFCDNNELEKRFIALMPMVKMLVEHKIVNPDTTYVWFKNNQPLCQDETYDDIRLSTIESDEYLGVFIPCDPHNNEKFTIFLVGEKEDYINDMVDEYSFQNVYAFKQASQENQDKVKSIRQHFYR